MSGESIAYDELDDKLPKLDPLDAAALAAIVVLDTLERLESCACESMRETLKSGGIDFAQRLPRDVNRLNKFLSQDTWNRLAAANDHPVYIGSGAAESYIDGVYHFAGWICIFTRMLATGVLEISDVAEHPEVPESALSQNWERVCELLLDRIGKVSCSNLQIHVRKECQRARKVSPEGLKALARIKESEPGPSLTLDEKALAVFFKNPNLTKIEIAKKIGCNAKSLAPSRCPKLSSAMAAYKAPDLPSGMKDAGGTIEAWDEDNEGLSTAWDEE